MHAVLGQFNDWGTDSMRKVIFVVANSVDNYIATKDGCVDWLLDSDEVNALLENVWSTVDAVVMGRITYEFSAANGMEAFPNMKNYVLSSTLNPAEHDKVTIVNEDTGTFLRRLKNEEGGDILVMGGAEILRECFKHGTVDELHLNIHPLLLGAGAPLFLELDKPVDLELLECRQLPHGCVAITYRVKH